MIRKLFFATALVAGLGVAAAPVTYEAISKHPDIVTGVTPDWRSLVQSRVHTME